MDLPTDYGCRLEEAVDATSKKIEGLLRARLGRAHAALQSLANYGPETGEEAADKVALLYEFWAVSRALGEVL